MDVLERIWDIDATIDLILGNSCMLSTLFNDLRVDSRFDIGWVNWLNAFRFDVNYSDGKINSLLNFRLASLVCLPSGLKVFHTDEIERSLMDILLKSEVHNIAEVLCRNCAIFEAFSQHNFICRDPKWHLMRSKHSFCHIDIYHNFTGLAHTWYHSIAWQSNCQMSVISVHAVEARLHDQRQWLLVSTMDNLSVLEWVCDFHHGRIWLNCSNWVTLNGTNKLDSFLLFQFESLFVVAVHDLLDLSLPNFHLFKWLDFQQVRQEDKAIWSHLNAGLLSTVSEHIWHRFAGTDQFFASDLPHIAGVLALFYHFVLKARFFFYNFFFCN